MEKADLWSQWIPDEAVKILLTVFLSFLIGLEREEQRFRTKSYHFGGIRTYPLIGLAGYILTTVIDNIGLAACIGVLAVVPFLAISYYYKITREQGGFTSEMAAVIALLSGILVGRELYWVAATVVVLNVLLLQAKDALEKLSRRVPPEEIGTFLKFLILTAVLLPIVPNASFTPFNINPFKTWLVVVAVSGISYGSYILQRLLQSHEGLFLSALLGGTYSSTATTVVMAKQSKLDAHSAVYPYAIAAASSLMYGRIAVLVLLFSRPLFLAVGWYFLALAAAGIALSYLGMRWAGAGGSKKAQALRILENRNPLEISTALTFAGLFVLILVGTRFAAQHFGHLGTWAVALLSGFVDVDAFVLGLAQGLGAGNGLHAAVIGIVLVASSNNFLKGVYALIFGQRKTGWLAMLFLTLLSLASLVVLLLKVNP